MTGDGFEVRRTLFVLEGFTDYPGLVVEMRAPAIGALLDIDGVSPKSAADEVLETFAAHLHSWNLTDGGHPVKAGLDAVRGLELPMFKAMFRAWMNAASGQDPTEAATPADGAVAGLPMTPLG